MRLSFGIGFGFVCPDTGFGKAAFADGDECELLDNYPLLSRESNGVQQRTRTVVVIKSTLLKGYDDPKSLSSLKRELTHVITNEEIDQLSAAKEALGMLYAERDWTGEFYEFSHIGYWMFASYN